MHYLVYRVLKDKQIKIIGSVYQPDVPRALLRAFNKWPEFIDSTQVQGGFL